MKKEKRKKKENPCDKIDIWSESALISKAKKSFQESPCFCL